MHYWLYILISMIVLALVGGYVVTSILLLRYPHVLHRRKKISFKCRHISHRGGAGENLENTMTAFKYAVDIGTDMLEIDCQVTKDAKVVVSHDNHLKRVTGSDVLISQTNYQDLPLLKQRICLDFSPGHETLGGEDRKIPLLYDVFDAFPNTPINIDIKVDSDELIKKVSNLTKEFNRENLTVWGNKSNTILKKCYKQNPDIHLFMSIRRVCWLMASFYTGLLPFLSVKESFFEIIMPSIIRDLVPDNELKGWQKALIHIIDRLLINRTLFKHLQLRGIQVYVWVLNKDEDYDKALKSGATGVMTDFPSKLKEFLYQHPEYSPKQ